MFQFSKMENIKALPPLSRVKDLDKLSQNLWTTSQPHLINMSSQEENTDNMEKFSI